MKPQDYIRLTQNTEKDIPQRTLKSLNFLPLCFQWFQWLKGIDV